MESPAVAVMREPSQRLLPPLQVTLKEAAKRGDVQGFHFAFPVIEQVDPQGNRVRVYQSLPFKQLKEFKPACAQFEPTATFTKAMLESLSMQALHPGDLKQLARVCLSGGKFLLWKSEFVEQCQKLLRSIEHNKYLLGRRC